MNNEKVSILIIKLFISGVFMSKCFDNIFRIKNVKNFNNKYIMIFDIFKFILMCLLILCILSISFML